jgi:hypothetical protein
MRTPTMSTTCNAISVLPSAADHLIGSDALDVRANDDNNSIPKDVDKQLALMPQIIHENITT